MRTLQYGLSGSDVLDLKKMLNNLKFRDDNGKSLNTNTNVFDVPCRQALKRGQRKLGLVDDGIYGPISQIAFPNYDPSKPVLVTPSKSTTQLEWESALRKTFTTPKQAYNLIIGTGYGHYNDDCLSYIEVLASLKGTIAKKPNCTDICQAFKKLLDAMGFKTRYIHKICQSGEGHITLEIFIDGGWVEIDPAAAISVGSQYSWGNVWCPNPRERWISNEAWLTGPDDGNMG